jgi:hypothetical protein
MQSALRTWSIRLLIVPACALVLAACSNSPSTSSSSTTSSTPASTTSSSSAGAASSTSTTSQTSGTLVPQTATVTEFYSPSKNISCEIDNNVGTSAVTSALCLTISPPKSVTLQADSTLTECTGVNCLSNAGTNTPTLAYGQSITLGPFTCSSSTAGMKCTLANGDGFLISSAATTALGNAKVAPGSS